MLPDILRKHHEITGNLIKKVANVRTVCEMINANPGAKKLCTELHCLLKLFLTIPVTTATAE